MKAPLWHYSKMIEEDLQAIYAHLRLGPVLALCLAGMGLVLPSRASLAECPAGDELVAAVAEIPLDRTTHATTWEAPLPEALLREALESPGTIAVAREGMQGTAVAVMPVSREALWKAVNDENGYAEHLGLAHSQVLGGTPRSTQRLLFQAFRRMGVGRWWVDRVWMSAGLYRETEGRIWELVWTDAFDQADAGEPPISEVAAGLPPVLWTRGAWAFAEIAPGCTLIDYFLWSDPGGMLSSFQALGLKGSLRDSVAGLVRYAQEVVPTLDPEDGPPFVRPDGTRLP